jgi:hypothetical protein
VIVALLLPHPRACVLEPAASLAVGDVQEIAALAVKGNVSVTLPLESVVPVCVVDPTVTVKTTPGIAR